MQRAQKADEQEQSFQDSARSSDGAGQLNTRFQVALL
jgi:hypothetical protein